MRGFQKQIHLGGLGRGHSHLPVSQSKKSKVKAPQHYSIKEESKKNSKIRKISGGATYISDDVFRKEKNMYSKYGERSK